jgi:hypothetical protein
MTVQDHMQRLIEDLAQESCISLFEAYGVKLTMSPGEADLGDDVRLTGVVGFTGPGILGMCLISGTDGPLSATNPAQGSLRDWMAELANQLAGRLKHKLIARGAVVYITTPIVLQGARIEPLPRHRFRQQLFESDNGKVALWVEAETAPEFVLSDGPVEEAVAEGEAMLL